jgi:U6 snRNA-associated Sm-like protein LSm4
MVEVKNGDTFQGMLESIDKFMNIKISEAIQTSKDGLDFFHCKELFIKGTSLKYFRLVITILIIIFKVEAALDKAIEESNICNISNN